MTTTMGRKRKAGADLLPQGVHRVPVGKVTYFYWQPGRGTARAGERIALGKDARSPEFWRKLDQLQGLPPPDAVISGSWADLWRKWAGAEDKGIKPSLEWEDLSEGTRHNYQVYMNLVVRHWGGLQVALTDIAGLTAIRGEVGGPSAGNQLIKVIRTAMRWGRSHAFPSSDVAAGLDPLNVAVEGATPWPEWAYRIVLTEAPEPLRRAAFLGRVTGQRKSDLVRMGKRCRRADGIEFAIKKLRGRKHFMPLYLDDLAVIDGWPAPDIGPYIVDHRGKAISEDRLSGVLKRFCLSHPQLKDNEVLMHGLRALAVCDRRVDGMSHQEIANQLCMSVEMVMQYSKGIDVETASREANRRRALNRGRTRPPFEDESGTESAKFVKKSSRDL
jgi:hypothetical protein